MALEYTEEKLNSLDRETIIQLFLAQQEQLKQIDHHLQLVLEQLSDLKRHRFGRSSERHGTDGQISFMEVDGQIVFFNEAEAVSAEDPDDCREDAPDTPRRRPKKEAGGNGEEDLEGAPGRCSGTFHGRKRTGGKDSDGKAGSSSPMRYTAGTVLLRQR